MVRGKPFKKDIKSLIKAGIMPKPIWMDIVEATRPPFKPIERTKTPKIIYPEDKLRITYLQRNPEVRRIPVNLKAPTIEERHIADRFVSMQMRFMQEQNMSEDDAYQATMESINIRHFDSSTAEDDLYGPLTSSSSDNEAVRLYNASVADSERDIKLRKDFIEQSMRSSPPPRENDP